MKSFTAICTSFLAASAGVLTSLCALSAPVSPTFKTSFECSSATAIIEKLVCRDSQLARMDLELARLYSLALSDAHSVPPPDKIVVDQQFWALVRNQCASERDPKACTVQSYAERAHQLRQSSAIARTKDPDRLTEGPVAFNCTGLNGLIAATFFNASPDVVYLKWANSRVTLSRLSSSLEAHYSGKDATGDYVFWQNGNEALFQKPGSQGMSCKIEPTS